MAVKEIDICSIYKVIGDRNINRSKIKLTKWITLLIHHCVKAKETPSRPNSLNCEVSDYPDSWTTISSISGILM